MNFDFNKDDKVALPDGWRWAKLGDVCIIIAGQSPPSNTYRHEPEGLPFFQGKADFGARHPIPRVWCSEPNKVAERGDILISVRAPVGPTNIADQVCCIGRGIAAIRCKAEIDMEFLLSWLKHTESSLAKKGSGSTFSAISRNHLENFDVPLPPLAEQKRIAAMLNEQMAAIDKARSAAEAQLVEINVLPAALLRRAFRGET
jgi:type I restriction enzyme S subunit